MNRIFSLMILVVLISCKTKSDYRDITKAKPVMCAPGVISVDALADTDKPAPLFKGMGDFEMKITTSSKKAQIYFNQGMNLSNAFNHAEAARSFKYATKLDPDCAMCHWGLAYVLGPNYNAGMEPQVVKIAYASVQKAVSLMDQISPKERALISAMAKRYPDQPVDDRSPYDEAYAEGLRAAYQQFPEEDHIGVLLAESLMGLHPWDLWDKEGKAKAWTPEILSILEEILDRNPKHIPTIHMYIHATEASFEPEKAMAYAEQLPKLAPAAGHLVHMPSHTYIRTGDYHLGTVINQEASKVDSHYVSSCHAAGAYPLAYYPHNIHFLAACAALEGQSKITLQASHRIAEEVDESMMGEPGLETLQHYWSIPFYTMVKFARWEDILDLPEPDAQFKYPRAIWHYARGMAYLGKKGPSAAQNELKKLKTLQQDKDISKITIWDINAATALVNIAVNVLEGELVANAGDQAKAIQLLEKAIVIEDALNYNEPPDWFFSVRHHLGPILIAEGQFEKAEKLYKTDLHHFPKNGWALNGLFECLQAQNKEEEAASVKAQFEEAWKYADVELKGSEVL